MQVNPAEDPVGRGTHDAPGQSLWAMQKALARQDFAFQQRAAEGMHARAKQGTSGTVRPTGAWESTEL